MNRARLVVAGRRLSIAAFDRIESTAAIVVFLPAALRSIDDALVERIANSRSMTIAIGAGELREACLAAALLSDFLALDERAELGLDGASLAAAGALVWRIGAEARRLLFLGGAVVLARRAFAAGVCDALVPSGEDSLQWLRSWLGARSVPALHSAAALIRRRGGEVAERAEFARLFATGEPQIGLRRFLSKQPPGFGEAVDLETI